MSHTKKKTNPYQAQKLATAHYKNEFFRKMKIIINSESDEDLFALIPKSVLEHAYSTRFHSFKYEIAKDNIVSKRMFDNCKVLLPHLIKSSSVTINTKGHTVTLTEFYTVYLTIAIIAQKMLTENYDINENLKSVFNNVTSNEDLHQQALTTLYNTLMGFIGVESALDNCLVWLFKSMRMPNENEKGVQNILEISTYKPAKLMIVIDENPRPAIEVCWAYAGMGVDFILLKPSVLFIKSPFAEIPTKVYIQSHAILRLAERLDCFNTGLLHFSIYLSLRTPKVCLDSNGNVLIEYQFIGVKVGYFRADIVDGVIVLRTFLFITNNTTPEGQLLEKNTGLQLFDKKYLAIDKMSTFMNSEIGTNQEIRNIFTAANCKSLLDMYEKMKIVLKKQTMPNNTTLMVDYLHNAAINYQPNNDYEIVTK